MIMCIIYIDHFLRLFNWETVTQREIINPLLLGSCKASSAAWVVASNIRMRSKQCIQRSEAVACTACYSNLLSKIILSHAAGCKG